MKAIELAKVIMKDIFDTYGITSTCGIGTNLYLAKIALDIMSKHSVTNIGWLTEERYQKEVIMQDERLSTVSANRLLISNDTKRKNRKKVVDKIAATIILQSYLDRRNNER
jgi:RNase H-fold protein (predicted Holliday junction resolvase)